MPTEDEHLECPICHNYITSDRGLKGSERTDENGESLPFWTEDPLLTPLGLAGKMYKGRNPIRCVHIQELQNYYRNLECRLGLEEEELTEFLVIDKHNPLSCCYIEQLRMSVEKILNKLGVTLEYYFQHDRRGNKIDTRQTDWTDVDRSIDGTPKLPKGCPIRAIHIEELRRGILLGWQETWDKSRIDIEDESSILEKELAIFSDGLFGAEEDTWVHGDTGGRLYADHQWSYLGGGYVIFFTATGDSHNAIGEGKCKWYIGETEKNKEDKILIYECRIKGVKHCRNLRAGAVSRFNFGTIGVDVKCNSQLRFKIFDLQFGAEADCGDIIVDETPCCAWGTCWDPEQEVKEDKETAPIGACVEFRVYFRQWQQIYISYFVKRGDNIRDPRWGIPIGVGDTSRNLYTDLKTVHNDQYGDLTEEQFRKWFVRRVDIYIEGYTQTVWNGFISMGGAHHVCAHTENAKLDIDFSVNKLQLI